MRKLIPILFALFGAIAGIAAAYVISPPKKEACEATVDSCDTEPAPAPSEKSGATEYVKINNQFVVPVISNDLVEALVVLSLSLEVAEGSSELVYAKEPKLRDRFLQVLFDYAHLRGFDGAFANSNNLDRLRRDLLRAAQNVGGPQIQGVLIVDIVRQDL